MQRSTIITAVMVCLATLLGAACRGDRPVDSSSSSGRDTPHGAITVFAAASLAEAFAEIGDAFEAEHAGTSVRFNFGASSSLREQILAGAPADVYAAANTANIDQLASAAAVDPPQVFATNRLMIAVGPGNPDGVRGLPDLSRPDLLVGLCAQEVPCGQLGRAALALAGVTPAVDTNALDARALLTRVVAGDVDAGLVYRTDVLAAGGAVEGVPLAHGEDLVAEYPIAVLAGTGNRVTASAFVELVLSDRGQRILASHGFGSP